MLLPADPWKSLRTLPRNNPLEGHNHNNTTRQSKPTTGTDNGNTIDNSSNTTIIITNPNIVN